MFGMYINDKYIENPLWTEKNLTLHSKFDTNTSANHIHLLLDKRTYNIFFFGVRVKLNPQEYKFLKAVLNRHGERISAIKVMKQIGSKCKTDLYKELSYRIKNKINSKIKKAFKEQYPDFCIPLPHENNGYELIDYEYEYNSNECQIINGNSKHYFDFDKYFKLLISVKDGFYFTDFYKLPEKWL